MYSKQKNSAMLWGGFILGTILLLMLLAKLGSSGAEPSDTGVITNSNLSVPVTDKDNSKGAADAPITLVEYSDFQCPACASFYPIIKQLSEEFPVELRVVYRHFPLRQTHPNAQLAGQAAQAAGLQEKFWEMHDALFNTQTDWANANDAEEFFVNLANSLGLDTEQFKTDMNSKNVKNRVNDDYNSGVSSGVPGTPTFFLNGKRISNPGSYAGFKQLISDAITQTGS